MDRRLTRRGYRPICRVSVEELLAARAARPIRSLDDLAADTFESDAELEEFLAFTRAERRRDIGPGDARVSCP